MPRNCNSKCNRNGKCQSDSKCGKNTKCISDARLEGKTAVLTGCNTGIGKETLLDFYKRGAHVVMACRDLKKSEGTKNEVMETCKGQEGLGSIATVKLDLASLKSIRECADSILQSEKRIHILVNNAGVMMCPQGKTEDGFETQFGTNHLGHFLFTILLLPRIIDSKPARIVTLSSKAHEFGAIDFNDLNFDHREYNAMTAYNQSKLANVLFTRELAKRLKENNIEGVNVYSLHPGVVNTELGRHLDDVYFRGATALAKPFKCFLKTPEEGAQTTIYCAVDEKCANETGLYYSNCAVKEASKNARNDEDALRLWDVSWQLVGLGDFNPFN